MLTPRQLTHAAQTKDTADGSRMLPNVQVEYSSVCPFNGDNTRLLLSHFSYFALYDGTGKYLYDCTENGRFEVNASSRPRWVKDNPDFFTYLRGNQIKTYNCKTRTSELLHTFTEYQAIDDGGEADLAEDGRCRVLCGTKPDGTQEIFVFNTLTGGTGPKLATEGHAWNNLYMAASSYQFIVGWSNPDGTPAYGTGPFEGVWMYDWDLKARRNIAVVQGHMDTGRDANDDPVVIWASGAQLAKDNPVCGLSGTGVVKIPLNSSKPASCVTTFPWTAALHISCPVTAKGQFFVSTYGKDLGLGAIYRCNMNGGSEKLIDLKTHAITYEQEPKVSCSRDGLKLVYIEGNDVWLADLNPGSTSVSAPPSEPSTPTGEFSADQCGIFRNGKIAALAISPELAARIAEKMNS